MDAYQQIFDPSQVSKTVKCHFIDENSDHLIVSKGTLLQVFEVMSSLGSSKLKLITEYKLQGLISDFQPIKTNDSKLDYLLVVFEKAKFVLVKWDHEKFQIETVSLHYYEQLLNHTSLDTEDDLKTVFKVDPNNQCAVLLYKEMLCFLPFHQDGEVDEDEEDEDDEYVPTAATTSGIKDITYPSFVMPASQLESSIRNIIDICFLSNYHEPTLAVLFQPQQTWSGSLPVQKDTTRLLVLSLDLVNKSSASIIDIDRLPYDLFQIQDLKKPIDGLLLVGCNELIHVNSNGGCSGVGVNEYYTECTNFKLTNMSYLNMKLEECFIADFIENNLILFDSITSKIFVVKFSSTRTKEITFQDLENHGLLFTKLNSFTMLKEKCFFVGCDGSDSLLVGYDLKSSHTLDSDSSGTLDIEDDEDFYTNEDLSQKLQNGDIEGLSFTVLDTLVNYGPITSFTTGQISVNPKVLGLPNPNYRENCIVASTGYKSGSAVSVVRPTVQPVVKSCLKFSNVNRIWTINDANDQSDYLITTNFDNFKTEIFKINDKYRKFFTADFNVSEITLFICKFGKDQILQVTTTSIKLYDYNFHLQATLKFEVELVFGYSYNDLILVTFQDGEVASFEVRETDVLAALKEFKKFEAENKKKKSKEIKKELDKRRKEIKDKKRFELVKIELPKLLNDLIITGGTIVNSSLLTNVRFGGVKRGRDDNPKIAQDDTKIPLIVLITADNRILVFQKNHNQKIFEFTGADTLSEYFKIELMMVNKDVVPDPQIKAITICELGDETDKEEYLIILTVGGQIILYKLFFNGVTNQFFKINEMAGLKLTGAPENAYPAGTKIERTLIPLKNFSGLNCVLVTGFKTYLITKTSKSLPKIHQFTSLNSVSMADYSNDKVDHGLIFIDDNKNARIVELDEKEDLENKLPVKKYPNLVSNDETIKNVEFHKSSNTFVISTFKETDYNALDEDDNVIPGVDETKNMRAQTLKGYVKLINPINWSIIDEIELEDNEVAMSVKSMNLDLSKTHISFKKEFIFIGTGKFRTEDLPSTGDFKIVEIIDIIPEPGRPETNHKFKQIVQEATKGAITAATELSGRFLTAQGSKLLVRDLQDDNTVMPVLFYDASVYITDVKLLDDLVIIGDTMDSVWLLGFDAEPYRMILLGRDLMKLDVQCVDFIVYDKQLYVLVADNDHVIHLLQYDPDDPTSQLGQKLIRKACFKINAETTMLKRIPKFEIFDKSLTRSEKFQCIGTNLDGSIFKVAPISETTYRNFYVVQQQIIDKEVSPFGLNPRMNRLGDIPSSLQKSMIPTGGGYNAGIQRPILDLDVVKSFINLNDDKRNNIANKIGKSMLLELYRDFIDLERTL